MKKTRLVGSVVEWLKCRNCDRHGLGSKPTRKILLCSWDKHFMTLPPSLRSWQVVLNFNHISIKPKYTKKNELDRNILASPEAGLNNCLPYVLAPPSLSCKSEEKNIEIK